MGLQGRALKDGIDPRWCSPIGRGWAQVGFLEPEAATEPGLLLVCEGPGDALAVVGGGYSVLFARGAALGKSAAKEIAKGTFERIVVCAHADAAGRRFAAALTGAMPDADVRVLCLPEGFTDVAEWCEGDRTGFEAGLTAALQGVNAPEAEQPHERRSVEPPEEAPDGGSMTAALVALALSQVDLFHTTDDRAFASVLIRGRVEAVEITHRGRSPITTWLRSIWLKHHRTPLQSTVVGEAAETLATVALMQVPEQEAFIRLAEHGEKLYLDLADPDGQVVEISTTGWKVVSEAPVNFVRARGMKPLPVPVRGGSIDDLRRFVNVADADWPLYVGWLVGTFNARGPYPLLMPQGEQGTGKSALTRFTRALIDPAKAALRGLPRDVRDLAIAAEGSRILAFDNVSSISDWLSDALCRIATGDGFATRELYADRREVLFESQCPVILNGIADAAERPDLRDRCVFITLRPIPPSARRDERTLDEEFKAAAPAILGALLDAVVIALREWPSVVLAEAPRMADFARFAVAAEAGLGLQAGEFLRAYTGNREQAESDMLTDNILCSPLYAAIPFDGTMTQLLDMLARKAGIGRTSRREWPINARALSGRLRELAPALRNAGIDIEFDFKSKERKRSRLVRIRLATAGGDAPSQAPAHPPTVRPSQAVEAPKQAEAAGDIDAANAADAPDAGNLFGGPSMYGPEAPS